MLEEEKKSENENRFLLRRLLPKNLKMFVFWGGGMF
jgi:hypothetical protein